MPKSCFGAKSQKQDSVIDGTHKSKRCLLDIFNKQKMEDGFSVLRLLIEMFALWAGAAARENTPVSVIDMKKAANRQPFSYQ